MSTRWQLGLVAALVVSVAPGVRAAPSGASAGPVTPSPSGAPASSADLAAAADAASTAASSADPAAGSGGGSAASTPAQAVRLAESAFAYRDFEQVVATLWPWMHPPLIQQPTLRIDAHRLLGVSLFVLGREAAAEAEFEALLRLDPTHQLDPFLVPPPVVQRFEVVRQRVAPGGPPAGLPSRAALLLPFGTPQFVLGQSGQGALWGWGQLISLGLNVGAYFAAKRATRGSTAHTGWVITQYIGLAGFLTSWGLSSAAGFSEWNARRDAQLPAAPGVPPAPDPTPERPDPTAPAAQLSLGLRF